ncbi:MAG: hypothetical protein AAFN94_04815 [Pseudomonadota bacterium]
MPIDLNPDHIANDVIAKIKEEIIGTGNSIASVAGDAAGVPQAGLDLLNTFGGTAHDAMVDVRKQAHGMFAVMNNDYGGKTSQDGAPNPYVPATRPEGLMGEIADLIGVVSDACAADGPLKNAHVSDTMGKLRWAFGEYYVMLGRFPSELSGKLIDHMPVRDALQRLQVPGVALPAFLHPEGKAVAQASWADLAAVQGHLSTITASVGAPQAAPLVTIDHDMKDPKVQQGLILVIRQVLAVLSDGTKATGKLVRNMIAMFPFSISLAGGGSAGVEFIGALLGDIEAGVTVFDTAAFLILLTDAFFDIIALLLDEIARMLDTVQGLMQLGVVTF